jgi:hypothetical protein
VKRRAPGLAIVLGRTEDDADEAPDGEAEETSGKLDTLLGNAFDAYEDGDRDGFIRSMRAAFRSGL